MTGSSGPQECFYNPNQVFNSCTMLIGCVTFVSVRRSFVKVPAQIGLELTMVAQTLPALARKDMDAREQSAT